MVQGACHMPHAVSCNHSKEVFTNQVASCTSDSICNFADITSSTVCLTTPCAHRMHSRAGGSSAGAPASPTHPLPWPRWASRSV